MLSRLESHSLHTQPETGNEECGAWERGTTNWRLEEPPEMHSHAEHGNEELNGDKETRARTQKTKKFELPQATKKRKKIKRANHKSAKK